MSRKWENRKGNILLYELAEPMRASGLLRMGHFWGAWP